MTANDPGHINNLSRAQTNALKQAWIDVINFISKDKSASNHQSSQSVYTDELFRAIGYDNPDVLLLRWLRSRKWDVSGAVNQIIATMEWRHEWGVQELIAKGEKGISQAEISTGKTYFMGHDKIGRPVCCIHPKEHVKGQFPHDLSEKLTVFCLETYRKILQPPMESVVIVFDMGGCESKNMDFHQIKFLINLVDNYYPDSLGVILILNFPWILDKSWTIIKSWLNAHIQKKVRFIHSEAELNEYIDPSVLPKRLGGIQPDFQYVPPSDDDEAMFEAFRADQEGKATAEAAHREAVRAYLAITLQWANSRDNRNLIFERKKARKELKLAFERLSPYITTRTHYHRTGVIKEPIFQKAYERLANTKPEEEVTFF